MIYVLCGILWLIAGWTANWMYLNEVKRVIGKRVEECSGKEADYDKIGDTFIDMTVSNSGVYDDEKKRCSVPRSILSFIFGVLLWPITFPIIMHIIHKYRDEIGQDMSDYAQRNE